jgi:hypothetical protein
LAACSTAVATSSASDTDRFVTMSKW